MYNTKLTNADSPVMQTLTFTVTIEVAGARVIDIEEMEANIGKAIDGYVKGITPEQGDSYALSAQVEHIVHFTVERLEDIQMLHVFNKMDRGFFLRYGRLPRELNLDIEEDVRQYLIDEHSDTMKQFGMI